MVSTGAVLTPGRYVVVPSCTGCTAGDSDPNACSEVGTQKRTPVGMTANGSPQQLSVGDEDSTWRFEGEKETVTKMRWENDEAEEETSFDCPGVLSGLKDMFWGLDADCDGVLSRDEVREQARFMCPRPPPPEKYKTGNVSVMGDREFFEPNRLWGWCHCWVHCWGHACQDG